MDADKLIAISLIITAAGTIISPILIFLNGRASKLRGEKQIEKIDKTEAAILTATNGVVTKLLEEKDKTLAAKIELSATEGHEEGLKNGRAESRIETLEQRIGKVEEKK